MEIASSGKHPGWRKQKKTRLKRHSHSYMCTSRARHGCESLWLTAEPRPGESQGLKKPSTHRYDIGVVYCCTARGGFSDPRGAFHTGSVKLNQGRRKYTSGPAAPRSPQKGGPPLPSPSWKAAPGPPRPFPSTREQRAAGNALLRVICGCAAQHGAFTCCRALEEETLRIAVVAVADDNTTGHGEVFRRGW